MGSRLCLVRSVSQACEAGEVSRHFDDKFVNCRPEKQPPWLKIMGCSVFFLIFQPICNELSFAAEKRGTHVLDDIRMQENFK